MRFVLSLLLLVPAASRANPAAYILLSGSPAIRHLINMLGIPPAPSEGRTLDVVPPASDRQLIDSVASLKTDGAQDERRLQEVLDMLKHDWSQLDADNSDKDDVRRAISKAVSDLYRLAHRYGEGDRRHVFLYPSRWVDPNAEKGSVIPMVPASPAIRNIAEDMPPHHDRLALADILADALPQYDLKVPSPEVLADVPDEDLALWALLVRTSLSDHPVWNQSAKTVLRLIASGRPDDFFHPSNVDYPLYFYLLAQRGTHLVYGTITLLEEAARIREENDHQSIRAVLAKAGESSNQKLSSFWTNSLRNIRQHCVSSVRNLFRRARH